MPKHGSKIVERMMKEVHKEEPSTVTRAKHFGPGGKEAMLRAIAFNKAREAGAKVPVKPRNTMSKGQRAMRDRSTRGSPPFSIPEFAKGFRAMPAMSKAMETMGMATKPDIGAMKHREEMEKAMGLERGKK